MASKKLMIPGPVDIPESVRQAMAAPSMPHYGTDWVRLLGETQEMAKLVFNTRNDLYIMVGPGTMALEAGMGSALEDGDSVLIPSNGFFADRLRTVAENIGLRPVPLDIPPGQPILPAHVEEALDTHPEIKAVLLVHHETSCGVINALEGVATVVRDHDKLLIVDAVSSMGGLLLPVDTWGIDLCVTVANKTLEIPPAVALLSVSPRAWAAIGRRKSSRGWYLDLRTWHWYAENWSDWHPTPATMPTSNIVALHHSLEMLLTEGLEQRYTAYRAAAQAVRAGLRALGFPMMVEDAFASPLTTAAYLRPGVDADDLLNWLSEHAGVAIAGGIGELHGQIVRVGHIGAARKRDYVVALLLGIEDYLRAQGESVAFGASLVALNGVEV